MRNVFLRAVLIGALAALALVVARQAWAEATVFVCTSATEPSPLRIVWDGKTMMVEDLDHATRDLYPLDQPGVPSMDELLTQLRRDGRYRCRRDS